jgi:3-oxoadipate enol-lactonase
MPFVRLDDIGLFYRLEASDGLPPLELSHSIGADPQMWEPQVSDLLPHLKILRFDWRPRRFRCPREGILHRTPGERHAGSHRPSVSKFAFCGLSLGGAIGQWIALRRPECLMKLYF